MHNLALHCDTLEALRARLGDIAPPDMIQLYSGLSLEKIQAWADLLTNTFPASCRIGMAVAKQVCQGQVYSDGVTLICSYFTHTRLRHNCVATQEFAQLSMGNALFDPIPASVKASIVLVDGLKIGHKALFDSIRGRPLKVAGGKAGLFQNQPGWILYQDKVLTNHALVVGFDNADLIVRQDAFVDFIPIGRPMRVTASEGRLLKQIDHLPAQQVYRRYLAYGEHLPLEIINLFALQYQENGEVFNSGPIDFAEDGALLMSEPLPEGCSVRFLYYHPWQDLHAIVPRLQKLHERPPESLLLFNCIGRENYSELLPEGEVGILNQVAETNGAYCFGEFFSSDVDTQIMQHTLTYLALNEDEPVLRTPLTPLSKPLIKDSLAPLFNLISNAFKDMEQEQLSVSYIRNQDMMEKRNWLYDPQTGLLNRFALISCLQNDEVDNFSHLAVFRVRNFRLINEQYGYDVADNLLAQLAQLLKVRAKEMLIHSDFICYRLSANEIAILLSSHLPARKLLSAIHQMAEDVENRHFSTSDPSEAHKATELLSLSLSVGVASMFDQEHRPLCERERLLIKASEARRHAHNTNQLVFWNGDLASRAPQEDNLAWVITIRKALEEHRIFPYFQPVFEAKTGRYAGAEALLRANIDGKIVSPAPFLDLVKQTQLYPKLTLVMLNACESLLQQHPHVQVAINLSILDFKHEATLLALRQVFKRNQFNGRITLEITESESIQDYQWLSPILQEFRKAGARLAIDDFGAGYSNLEKLIQLEPDVLKLDGSIIRTIDTDPKLKLLVKHINALAHSLNIKTLAEFVHSQAVMDVLTEIGVDYLQGFHLSPPIPQQDWLAMLNEPQGNS